MAKRQLTEKQQKFLDVLFEEAEGNLVEAKRLAGYSDNVATSSVVNPLQDEIAEATKKYIATNGALAAAKLVGLLNNPTTLGAKEILAASKDILDRAGHKASDKVELSADTPLFILPEKKTDG